MKPIVKWAGGKTQLLNEILPLVPKKYNTYYEVFFGGGALYFELQPDNAILNDFNSQLINLYRQVKNNPIKLMKEVDRLTEQHSDSFYYTVREAFNKSIMRNECLVQSSRFLYLNKACFNGLYRLNSNGKFNVPSAHRKKIVAYDRQNILDVSAQLNKNVRLLNCDFEEACKGCEKGDFVFFDSPYYNTFDTYQANGFGEDEHIRLRNLYNKLTEKGIYCMLTNSNEQFIKEIYQGYDIKVIKVKRMINCDGKNRTGEEIIITNYSKIKEK